MSKWKCEICGSEFDNFHAQGFENKIYCPLCYFKKLSADLQVENFKLNDKLEKQRKEYQETYKDVREEIKDYKVQLKQRDEIIDEAIDHLDAFISDTNLSKYDVLKILMYTKKIIKKAKGDN